MSEIKVVRKYLTNNSTIGILYKDNLYFCYTLEDVVREPGVKILGKTAIPEGRYQIIIDQSARFKRAMPHILNVPGFEGIRIHKGNTAENTEGCILLGEKRGDDHIADSTSAFNRFFTWLAEELIKDKVFISIEHEAGVNGNGKFKLEAANV